MARGVETCWISKLQLDTSLYIPLFTPFLTNNRLFRICILFVVVYSVIETPIIL